MNGTTVSIAGITKNYGSTPVLSDINLDVQAGEFVTLLGPSGCGKSTLLRIIAGFEGAAAGALRIGGRSMMGVAPKHRGLSMVFQNYALYPHLTVSENIAMPLIMRRLRFFERLPYIGRVSFHGNALRREIGEKVGEIARILEIGPLLERRPGQLSGGQRQRVALGRAMISEPSLFLMDEPLSNLDARLRIQMRKELKDLHRLLGITFLYVTHDQVEAMSMSGRIAVMMEGRLVQVGTPHEVYMRPADLRVARFIGEHPINSFPADVEADGRVSLFGKDLPARIPIQASAQATLGIRPEAVELDWEKSRVPGNVAFEAKIVNCTDHGADLLVEAVIAENAQAKVLARVPASKRLQMASKLEDSCCVRFPISALHLFAEDGKLIPWIADKNSIHQLRAGANER